MNRKLLFVIEDDPYIRANLVELLEMEDYEVRSFAHGKDALETLALLARLPDLVILDLMMPVMNGYEFLDELSKQERFQKLPVLVVSADRQASSLGKAQVRGILQKPIDLEHLLKLVQRFSGAPQLA